MKDNSLSILDIGHGNCAVLKMSTRLLIVDAGPGTVLLRFLTENKIASIDYVLISHADEDHVGGLLALLHNGISISKVRLNSDAIKKSATWHDLSILLTQLDLEKKIDFQVNLTADGLEAMKFDDINVEVLAPSKHLVMKGVGSKDRNQASITSNSLSAVIRVSKNSKPIAVFLGDLDEVGLNEISHNKTDISASIMVYPHHGGRSNAKNEAAFARQLCERVMPSKVYFSIGRGRHQTPRPEIIKSIRLFLAEAYIGCTQLSENCLPILHNKPQSYLGSIFAAGREKGKSCAGTITVNLDNIEDVNPSEKAHAAFIRAEVPAALCQAQWP